MRVPLEITVLARRGLPRPIVRLLSAVAVSCFLVSPALAEDTFTAQKDVTLPMSDGIGLSTDIFLPAGDGPFPTILIRTAYGKNQMDTFTHFFAESGYATVIQDVRGKWESSGDMVPFVSEQKDGLETLDWIVAQEWCNGRIGLWGSSYLSYCALTLAAAPHPAVKTIFNMSGWLNGDKINSPGGALHWMLMLTWMLHEATQQKRSLNDYDIWELFEHIPLKSTMASIGIDDPVFSNPDTLETVRYDYSTIQIPIYHITGWYDFIRPGALTVYNEVSSNTSTLQKLMIGPWVHDQIWTTYTQAGDVDFGERAAMGIDKINAMALRWFDRWLKDEANGVSEEPAVDVFVMGRDEWLTLDAWPPGDLTYGDWHINSSGGANTQGGDGVLVQSPPERDAAHDTFVFDPMDPVPTFGGANFHFFPEILGIKDQRDIEERDDVLVYTSAPLEEETIICGPVRVILYVSTEARDTDFTAKLVEVRNDGYAAIIVEGIARASFRHSLKEQELLEPGEIYEIGIDLGETAIEIRPGHRLRLEISSSNFPKYDRNPNTGVHPWEAVEYQKTTQTIYHDEAHPSRVILPVLTSGSSGL